jgi:hypothetical protein
VWSYAALIIGALVLAVGVGRRLSKRTEGTPKPIDMGQLSDSWLAEQRGTRDRS